MTPEAWHEQQLSELCERITDGSHFSPPSLDEGIPIATVANMGSRWINLSSCALISEEDFVNLERNGCRPRAGDVLLSKDGSVGKVLVMQDSPKLVLLSSIAIVTPTHSKLDSSFLGQSFKWPRILRQLHGMRTGSAIKRVVLRDLRRLRLAVPPLPEQRKIAAVLSSVDDAIEKTQAVIDQVQVVMRGLMQELLTRGLPGRHTRFKQTEIGEIPEEWSCVSLGSLVVDHNSGVYKKADLYGRGHNIVGVSDLYGCHSIDGQQFSLVPLERSELSRYTLHEGDLIYGESSLVREGIARTLPVTQRGAGTAFAWHTRRVRLDYKKTDAIFYHYVLDGGPTRKRVMAVATQTALTGITTKDFFSVPVPLPAMDEQREISRILTSNDKLIEECQDFIDGIQAVKSALMSVLLTGELRVTPDTEAQ